MGNGAWDAHNLQLKHCHIKNSPVGYSFRRSTASGIIPVLGVGVVDDSELYLLRLFYSIDYPVKHKIVVVGGQEGNVVAQVGHILNNFENVTSIQCTQLIGVSEGWNAILTAFQREEWFLIVAFDVAFMPGSLKLFAERFWVDSQEHQVPTENLTDMGFFNIANFHVRKGGFSSGAYNAFAVTQRLMRRAGLFDENIYPAFCEDAEFNIRVSRLNPGIVRRVYHESKVIHGAINEKGYKSGLKTMNNHLTRRTIGNNIYGNCRYVLVKWGCKTIHSCKYATPYNQSYYAINFWEFDHKRRKGVTDYLAQNNQTQDFLPQKAGG